MSQKRILLGIGAGPLTSGGGGGGDTPPAVAPYLMACFKPLDEKLYLLTSNDSISWTQLYGAIYTPPSGSVRDPSITYRDGKWWIVYTNAGSSFGLASAPSADLSTWTWERNVSTAAIAGIDSTWAPEWFIDDDDSVHVLFAASTDSNVTHKLYEIHPTAADFSTWSAPVDIGQGTNYIDAFVVKIGSTYYLLCKNETTSKIECWTSSSLTSGWSLLAAYEFSLQVEGPSVIDLGGGVFRMFHDYYNLHQYHYKETSDSFATMGVDHNDVSLPYQIQHGTIMKLV